MTVGTRTSAVFTASASSALRHRLVVGVEPGVEQFAHARLDRSGSLRVTMTSGFFFSPSALNCGTQAALPPGSADSALINRARRHCALVATIRPFFLPDGRDKTKLPDRTRRPRIGSQHYGSAGRLPPGPPAMPRTGTASGLPIPRFRQPEVRPGQCAVRTEQGSGRALGLHPRRACRSRSPPSSRTGAASATGKGAEGWVYHSLLSGKRTAVVVPKTKDELVPALRKCRNRFGGIGPAAIRRARDAQIAAMATGASSAAKASTAGSSRNGCGAPIRTRRWSRPKARAAPIKMAGTSPASNPRGCL